MFRGVTNLTLDAKGRVAVPAKYRDQLLDSCAGHLVISVDGDGCLLIYPLFTWEQIEQKLINLPSLNKQARRLQRLLLGHATECELDAQGRILLPAPLREFAGLDKHAVLIGQGNKFELWDETTWSEKREQWLKQETEATDLSSALEDLSL